LRSWVFFFNLIFLRNQNKNCPGFENLIIGKVEKIDILYEKDICFLHLKQVSLIFFSNRASISDLA